MDSPGSSPHLKSSTTASVSLLPCQATYSEVPESHLMVLSTDSLCLNHLFHQRLQKGGISNLYLQQTLRRIFHLKILFLYQPWPFVYPEIVCTRKAGFISYSLFSEKKKIGGGEGTLGTFSDDL